MKRSYTTAFFLVLTEVAAARSHLPPWFLHTPDKAWLHNYDPTLLSPRLHSELSYQDFEEDPSKFKLETSWRWATSIKENHAFGLQAMLPIVLTNANSNDPYFDNLELRTGITGKISGTLRYGIALNAALDTANSSYAPNSPDLTLRPIAAIRYDLSEKANIGLQSEYTFTPYDEDENDLSALELKLSMALKFDHCWSGAITYKPRWDFTESTNRQRISLSTTRNIGQDHQYALSFGVELPLSEQDLDYKLSTSLSWYY